VFAAPDYNTGGSGEVLVEVKKGQSASEIGAELQAKDVVKSQKAFIKAADANPRSREIQPGFYKLRKQMRAADALALILDRTSRWVWQAKIIDGWSYKRTFAELSKVTGIPVAEFEAAAKDPIALGVPDFWFNRRDGKPAAKSIEGFLFPDTYEFAPNSTAVDILKEMVGQFIKVVTELNLTAKVEGELKVSPFEALIVASLAQAEAGIKEDLPHVARVAYNRVFKANMPLEFDVTANYWLELNGKDPKHSGQLTPQELNDPKNPYNTKSVRGLPVGPINSPSRAALEGAMSPTPGKAWLYFVAIDKTGRSAFADTLAEHNRNIQQACRNGVPLC
jgi:UPF0755 protein